MHVKYSVVKNWLYTISILFHNYHYHQSPFSNRTQLVEQLPPSSMIQTLDSSECLAWRHIGRCLTPTCLYHRNSTVIVLYYLRCNPYVAVNKTDLG